jgi:hypothetical protein
MTVSIAVLGFETWSTRTAPMLATPAAARVVSEASVSRSGL